MTEHTGKQTTGGEATESETPEAESSGAEATEAAEIVQHPDSDPPSSRRIAALLVSVLILSACGITYELLIGAIASYLLGGSVFQFSLTIGVFLASMGVGAYLSRFIKDHLLERFIAVELAISLVGGFSGALLFLAFTYTGFYYVVMFSLIVLVGSFIGLEIPLLTRYLQQYRPLSDSIAHVFSLDYLGSLLASVFFPLVALPYLGIFKTSLVVGLLNVGVALFTIALFRDRLQGIGRQLIAAAVLSLMLIATLAASSRIMGMLEAKLYRDEVIYAEQTRYQRMVLTRYRNDTRLYLNGSLQFSSRDEYRYHESLVHPAMSATASRSRVLVIGGGDGLVLRQVLKYKDVEQATLVDIDPAVTKLARSHLVLRKLNGNSLEDPRVKVLNTDAYSFLERSSDLYSVVIIDLPDPQREALTKLYSVAFYKIVERHLARGGVAVTQATSPLFARRAYWCIETTARAAGFRTLPYHVYVPSFGDWGFVLFAKHGVDPAKLPVTVPTRFLRTGTLAKLTRFPADQARVSVEANTLDRPIILNYYEEGWKTWF
jgi:spermidine synthase